MGIPLVEGRGITWDDTETSERVIVVNEVAARRFFGGETAVGRYIHLLGDRYRIVGVAGDVRFAALESVPGPEAYVPFSQLWQRSSLDMVVRSSLPPEAIVGPVTDAIRAVDPGMAPDDHRPLSETVAQATATRRFVLWLLGAFTSVALVLASIGIYGVLSCSVGERSHEIGIRLALGSSRERIRRAIVGRTMALALLGAGIGLVLAGAGAQLIASMLFGVDRTDPATIGATVLVILAVSALAAAIPAVRASRTDSMTVLRG